MYYLNVKPFFKLLTPLLITLLLLSCSSKKNDVGSDHALVVEKWKGLATYAKIENITFPFTIAAELAIVEGEAQDALRFSQISITHNVNHQSIDLLSPTFDRKFICNQTCKPLTEYIEFRNSTLLKEYFNFYEFDLFNLYGELFLLTQSINNLKNSHPDEFDFYVNWLTMQGKNINQLSDFTLFLKKMMTESEMRKFIITPKLRYSYLLQETLKTQEIIYTNEPDGTTPKESVQWEGALNNEEINHWGLLNIAELKAKFNNQQKLGVDVGSTVCTFDTNIFGVVVSINGQKITIEQLGVAQALIDGQLLKIAPGALFSSFPNKNIISINGYNTLPINSIAQCKIE